MNINTYKDIETRISSIISVINGFKMNIGLIEDSPTRTDPSQIARVRTFEEQIHINEEEIKKLTDIKNAYNLIDKNIKEIKKFKLSNISDYKSGIEALDKLRKEINESINNNKLSDKLIDEILKKNGISRDYFDKIRVETKDKTNKYPEVEYYKNEFDKLEKEVADILGGRDINEISISELDSIYEKYEEIKEKKIKLKNKFDVDLMDNLKIFSEKEIKEILDINKSFDEGLEAKQKSAKDLKENKERLKVEFEEQVVIIKENIDIVQKQISIYEDEIRELQKNPTENQFEIIGRRSKINELKKYVDLKNDEIKEINEDIDRLENGGIIKNAPSKEEKIDLEKEFGIIMGPKPLAPTPAAPAPTPGAPAPTPAGPTPTPTPGAPAPTSGSKAPKPAPSVSNTLEDLANNGVIPRLNYLKPAALYRICGELGINVKDTKVTALTDEQIERLKNDHDIQSALLNQRIFDRNTEKIAKYDELIAKYKTILDSKLDIKTFTQEYIDKVNELHDKLVQERDNLEAKNKKITAFDHSEIYKNEGHMIDENYEVTLSTRNDKLKGEYKKVDDLREDSKKAHSKFKQRSIERNINRTLNRIKKLQSKSGKISSKQTEIINRNSEKYINKITSSYSKHLAKQSKLEHSVDNINSLSERLNASKVEQNLVNQERKKEKNLFEKIGLDIENLRLKGEIKLLDSDIKKEEKSVSRGR